MVCGYGAIFGTTKDLTVFSAFHPCKVVPRRDGEQLCLEVK